MNLMKVGKDSLRLQHNTTLKEPKSILKPVTQCELLCTWYPVFMAWICTYQYSVPKHTEILNSNIFFIITFIGGCVQFLAYVLNTTTILYFVNPLTAPGLHELPELFEGDAILCWPPIYCRHPRIFRLLLLLTKERYP